MSRKFVEIHSILRCGDTCPNYRDEEIDVHHGCAWTPPRCIALKRDIYGEDTDKREFPVWCPLEEDV